MLDLVRTNAPQHMDNPEFQQDMLEAIDDALKRMAKVQNRLSALKSEIVPNVQATEISSLLDSCCEHLSRKFNELKIDVKYSDRITANTGPEFLSRILENLLLNAKEAGATYVEVLATVNEKIEIKITDNGPGIDQDLLPWDLFEPFKTGKPNGSGIGLWQVRQLVEALGGEIQASNAPDGGALFVIVLPVENSTSNLLSES